jgi:putative transposase
MNNVTESRRLGAFMANTYHQIYIQTVFAVRYRGAMLDDTWRRKLFGIIGNLVNETGCKTLIVNGVEDHVHCLFALKPTVPVSELMKTVKAKSSKYVNDYQLTAHRFEWQDGYGAFSYSRSQIENVFNYISDQEEHHRRLTFREEYIGFLKDLGISHDERYIFKDLE